jgi:hypothetical protein
MQVLCIAQYTIKNKLRTSYHDHSVDRCDLPGWWLVVQWRNRTILGSFAESTVVNLGDYCCEIYSRTTTGTRICWPETWDAKPWDQMRELRRPTVTATAGVEKGPPVRFWWRNSPPISMTHQDIYWINWRFLAQK